jgi:hypothetical protein
MEMKQHDRTGIAEDTRKWVIHGHRSHKLRNLAITVGLVTLFSILMFAKLSPIQGYAVAAAFISLAAYAIILGFRD